MTNIQKLRRVKDSIQRAEEALVEAYYDLESLRVAEALLEDAVARDMVPVVETHCFASSNGGVNVVKLPIKGR